MSELADEHDLGSCAAKRGGSSPPFPNDIPESLRSCINTGNSNISRSKDSVRLGYIVFIKNYILKVVSNGFNSQHFTCDACRQKEISLE